VWWQRWQKRATSRTSVPHFGHFTVFCGAAVAEVPAASGDAADALGGAVFGTAVRGAGAGLSALWAPAPALGSPAVFGAVTPSLGTALPGCRATGLSEVVPLMLKFYRGPRSNRHSGAHLRRIDKLYEGTACSSTPRRQELVKMKRFAALEHRRSTGLISKCSPPL
jgi:hypothetical protein